MWVIGRDFLFLCNSLKKGITEPLLLITFPYLTIETLNLFGFKTLAEIKSLSEHNFDAPYKLTGDEALSVDRATICLILLSNEASIIF